MRAFIEDVEYFLPEQIVTNDDLERENAFFVKLFEGIAGQPDPVSDLTLLRFGAPVT